MCSGSSSSSSPSSWQTDFLLPPSSSPSRSCDRLKGTVTPQRARDLNISVRGEGAHTHTHTHTALIIIISLSATYVKHGFLPACCHPFWRGSHAAFVLWALLGPDIDLLSVVWWDVKGNYTNFTHDCMTLQLLGSYCVSLPYVKTNKHAIKQTNSLWFQINFLQWCHWSCIVGYIRHQGLKRMRKTLSQDYNARPVDSFSKPDALAHQCLYIFIILLMLFPQLWN